jgi:hypothetical protein
MSVPICKEPPMCKDSESLSTDRGVHYRDRVIANAAERALVATEYELLAEHVAFLFGAIDSGPQGGTS